MKRPRRAKLLTLEQLEAWFNKAEPVPPCGGVSMMNGFLTGLAAGPVFLLPNDWMFHVIGDHEKKALIGNKIQAVIDTIVDHYNLIAHQLTAPGRYAPMLMRTDEGEVLAGDWADGFFGAISLNLEDWAPLFAQKQTGEPIMGILIQCTKPDLIEIISTAFPKPTKAILKDAWRTLPFAVESIYAHCKPMRFNPSAPANDA
ncbi:MULTISPECIES: YecA/YgfB family protein [unclassified Shinella]|uniref:YecA/YgfB family protein n=1 Tax=unclassified Shinella TaxID=2643062 RepID=UPI00225D18F9|nr:YecA family protein [Shinella sp. YE25]MDC7259672.1 YecA family protein [Shinella sp. YE25]CAI0334087.1 YecA family protein [Rhizobiaceae bacterium]CAK7261740.1 YecA family protein [Shinella sp. WSC3-e]